MNIKTFALITFAATALAAPSDAALYDTITLSHGNASFTWNNLRSHPNDTLGGRSNLSWDGNHLYQLWFWTRETNQTREFALSNQQNDSWVNGNQAFLHYVEVLPGGSNQKIDVELHIKFEKIILSSYRLRLVWKVRNISPAISGHPNRQIRFYSYADIDAGGNSTNTVSFPQEDKFYFAGPSTDMAFESASDEPDVWRSEVADFGSSSSILTRLSDSLTQDLTTNLGSFNNGLDRAAAFEHVATLNTNQVMQGTIYVSCQRGVITSTPHEQHCTIGEHFGGGLGDLGQFDNQGLQYLPNSQGSTLVALYDQAVLDQPDLIRLSLATYATRPGTAYGLYLYDWSLAAWSFWNGAVTPTTSQLTYVDKSQSSGGTAQFIRDADGLISAYLSWNPVNDEDPSADGWVTTIDQFQYAFHP